ncbi:MAG TPA: type I-MYXAN CRISPR-associated protein Cmx8, partial [bacterium]|nr:type I-MYXAN CRISPR-associated protein Cmx8 [bacterium]
LEKQGNNIRKHTSDRIVPSTWLIHDYENLMKECRNPIYKSQRIQNLLDGSPWHNGFNSIFQKYPWEFFIYSKNKTPKVINFFGQDVEKKFRNIKMEGGSFNMDAEIKDDQLAVKIYGLIKQYVNRTTEEKSGQKYEDFKNQKNAKGKINYPEKYLETREKICSNAFLAMRGRRDKDFIEYFTGTICSVPQWMPEADYVLVGQALIENWELVKTYSMLALSACSFVGKSTQNDDSKGDEQ